jgi:hypothetical protein
MRTHHARWHASGFALLLVLSLAACGVSPASSTSGNPTPGSAALNGCLTQHAPSNWSPADVVLTASGPLGVTTTPSSDYITHVTVTHGQIIDMRMDATWSWRITTVPSPALLPMSQPAGWYDAQHRACIWRFTAMGSGTTPLDLSGGMVCPPHAACPAIAAIAYYQITVR